MKKISSIFVTGISILPALLVMPAMADAPNISSENPAFVFGDVSVDGQHTIDNTAFGGRRMEWTNNKYRNEFPKYQMIGRSFELSDSVAYVGPVTLTLRELTENDHLAYNWADNGVDTDIANAAHVDFGNTSEEIYLAVANVINEPGYRPGETNYEYGGSHDNAYYTAPGVIAFANRDITKVAGSLSFDSVSAAVDGSTVNANVMGVTNGSNLTFVKTDPSSLSGAQRFYTGVADIDSDGATILNTTTLSVNNSHFIVKRDQGVSLTINANNAAFANVTSGDAALFIDRNGSVEINGNTLTFNNNKSASHGGAFYYKDIDLSKGDSAVFNSKNITFNNNEVKSSDTSGSGGAIFVAGGNVSILGENNTFTNNKMNSTVSESRQYKTGGGAIANQSYWNENDHTVAVDANMIVGKNQNSVNAFSKNTSVTNGGAIMNRAIETDGNAIMTINGTTTFADNHANINGGAVYNLARDGRTTKLYMNNGSYNFTGNTADEKGGAIYNEGTIILANATFTNNKANGIANDIYNAGTLNIASGTTTIGGGITGNGTLNIASGSTLNIGTASVTQDAIDLDGTMLATLRSGDDAQITAGTFTGDGVLKLAFDNPGTYKVFGDADFDNIEVNSSVYDLSWNAGTVTTVAKSAEAIVAANSGISSDSGKMISALASSDDATASRMSLAIQESLANGDVEYVEQEVSKMNPEKAPVTSSVALSVQNQVLAAAGERMSLPLTGRSGGDMHADLGVWAKGMYNKTKHNGLFKGNTWGGSVGVDTDLNHSVILGAGYSFGDTNVDLGSHDVDIDSNTLFVYGQYRNSNWFVNGTIAYTMSKYDWNKNVFGIVTNPAYHVNSLSEQIMSGYHLGNGVTPTVGLRYLDVHQDSYKDGITTVAAMDSTYLTGVAGMDYKYTWIAPYTSLFWNPELHVAATYDIVSDSDAALVMVPGAAAYTVESDNLSRLGGEFGVGITAEYYYLTVSLNYDLNVHQNYTSQTGSFKVKYKF